MQKMSLNIFELIELLIVIIFFEATLRPVKGNIGIYDSS